MSDHSPRTDQIGFDSEVGRTLPEVDYPAAIDGKTCSEVGKTCSEHGGTRSEDGKTCFAHGGIVPAHGKTRSGLGETRSAHGGIVPAHGGIDSAHDSPVPDEFGPHFSPPRFNP